MNGRREGFLLVTVAAAIVLAIAIGCGGEGDSAQTGMSPQASQRSTPVDQHKPPPPPVRVAPSHCPPGLPSCRTTEGLITYVERVDPDGDGDAHFVIADSQSITLPGLTAIDVREGLRPRPLPRIGQLISAAGPVQTGSYGQSQIHALELHVAER
jgi:hypothetical protein